MFIIRFIVLLLLVSYGWSMGQIPPDGLNGFGKLIAFSFFLSAPALYLLPVFEAWKNQHPNISAIALVNVFLGWSLIGWVVAIVWAFKKPEASIESPAQPASATHKVRQCPFCAEEVKFEAIKCKHCQSDLSTT